MVSLGLNSAALCAVVLDEGEEGEVEYRMSNIEYRISNVQFSILNSQCSRATSRCIAPEQLRNKKVGLISGQAV